MQDIVGLACVNCMHFSNLGVNELSKKSLMVSEVTTVLKFWGQVQVVVANTFGTCLAGYGRDFHVSTTFQPLLSGLVLLLFAFDFCTSQA